MQFQGKLFIGCIPDYTYGEYFYFKNMIDTPNEDHNNSILNHGPTFYIKPTFKLCDDMFESLSKLFVDKVI